MTGSPSLRDRRPPVNAPARTAHTINQVSSPASTSSTMYDTSVLRPPLPRPIPLRRRPMVSLTHSLMRSQRLLGGSRYSGRARIRSAMWRTVPGSVWGVGRSSRNMPAPSDRRVDELAGRQLDVEALGADPQVEVEQHGGGGDEGRGDDRRDDVAGRQQQPRHVETEPRRQELRQ